MYGRFLIVGCCFVVSDSRIRAGVPLVTTKKQPLPVHNDNEQANKDNKQANKDNKQANKDNKSLMTSMKPNHRGVVESLQVIRPWTAALALFLCSQN